jgi:hypothetical protein
MFRVRRSWTLRWLAETKFYFFYIYNLYIIKVTRKLRMVWSTDSHCLLIEAEVTKCEFTVLEEDITQLCFSSEAQFARWQGYRSFLQYIARKAQSELILVIPDAATTTSHFGTWQSAKWAILVTPDAATRAISAHRIHRKLPWWIRSRFIYA